jgi:hypothetical protein
MEQNRTTKIIALLMLLAGALLLVQTCTSSDPIDLQNPSNNVSPQRLGQRAIRDFQNIKPMAIPEFQNKTLTAANLDIEALKRAQKKYELSLKKKEDASKKKKVTKKKKLKAPVAKRNNNGRYLSNEPEAPTVAANDAFTGGAATPARATETPESTNPNPDQQGYEYWRNLVFSNPSQQTSEQLLAAYLQDRIPADWFYRINDEMIGSSNGFLQESAINLLAMTPSSESFNRLSLVIEERNTQPNLKLLARESMNDVYKNINYLGALASALQNSNTGIAYHAARMIHLSAQTNLNAANSDLFIKAITSAKQNTTAYTQLLPTLDQIRQTTTNERLREFATNAYQFISQYLNQTLTAGLDN